jgi:hypothetical protein
MHPDVAPRHRKGVEAAVVDPKNEKQPGPSLTATRRRPGVEVILDLHAGRAGSRQRISRMIWARGAARPSGEIHRPVAVAQIRVWARLLAERATHSSAAIRRFFTML